MKLTVKVFTLITCFSGCLAAEESSPNPSLEASPQEDNTEIGMFSKEIGIDFNRLEQKAIGGSLDAIRVIIALNFDGGASDVMSAIRPKILAECPTEEVARALENYSPEFRAKIITEIREELQFPNGDEEAVKAAFDQAFEHLITKEENSKEQNKPDQATPRKPSD